ncbi:hypothetical protein [Hamadaea tsunoensis]|uniref:hypothetical protein n=1 Tax=Hamadaea tsunoensis TaxID=53368 RepID=UPI000407DE81|nr:hypothetical protein [Hamadaea tsunoensis]
MVRMLRRVLRAYPGQAAVLGVLCFILAAIALAAPAYARLAQAQLRDAQLAVAPPIDRTVTVRADDVFDEQGDRGKVDRARETLQADADKAGLTQFVTLQLVVRARAGGHGMADSLAASLISRDGACERLAIDGRCPDKPGEVLLGRAAAKALGVSTGGTIVLRAAGTGGVLDFQLTVAGLYAPPNGSAYWSTRADMSADPRRTDTPIIAGADTVNQVATSQRAITVPVVGGTEKEVPADKGNATTVTAILDLMALDADSLPGDLATARADLDELRQSPPEGFTAASQVPEFFDRVSASERALGAGIMATAGGVILIGGFVLLLAAWYAAAQRASKTTLAVLRGVPVISRWWFAAAPSALVALLGSALGAAAGRVLVPTPLSMWDAVFAAGVLVALPVGVLLVEARALRLPVLAALRQAHPASSGRRVDPLDLAVLAAAGVMIYQLATGAPDRGFAPLGPPVIVLAAALLAGRGLTAATVAVSGQRLRRGDLATGLAAAHISRRSSAPRLFALLVAAVALFGLAVTGYDTTSTALQDRARLELGADRVLTVTGSSYTAVRAAVHSADPQGQWLLAAARDQIGTRRVVAVESDRLVRVAGWTAPDAARLAGLLHPAANPAITVDGTALALDVTVVKPPAETVDGVVADPADAEPAAPVEPVVATPIKVNLVDAAGNPIRVVFPVAGSGHYVQPLAGCASGCRLAYLGFERSIEDIRITGLAQQGPDRAVLDGKALAEPGLYRDGFTTLPGELTVLHGGGPNSGSSNSGGQNSGGWLSARYVPDDPRHMTSDLRILSADMPVPLPVVAAGTPDVAQTDFVRQLPVLTNGVQPVRIAAAVAGLPGVGADGYLLDQEYADRLAGTSLGSATSEVWARADTPAGVLAAIRRSLSVTGEETVAQRQDRMMRAGPGQSVRFRLVTALLGVLLAAGGLAVAATAEHRMRLAELRDLRRQGLRLPVAVRAVGRSFAVLVGAGVATGAVIAAATVGGLARVTVPVFIDRWTATGVPVRPGWGIALAGLAVALLIIGGVGAYAASRLARALRSDGAPAPVAAAATPDLVGAAR